MSSSSGSNIRRTIVFEIEKLDDKIKFISKLKQDAVEDLMKKKHEHLLQRDEILGEGSTIDEEIERIEKRHTQMMVRQSKIHTVHDEYEELEASLVKISSELQEIQERHENAMKHLSIKREYLEERLQSIETLAELDKLTEDAMHDEMNSYVENLLRLKEQRSALLRKTDMSPEDMAAALSLIDRQMEELEGQHILAMNNLNKTYDKLQDEIGQTLYNPSRKEEIMKELERLKLDSLNATPSELALIEKRIEELQKELDQMQILIEIEEESSHDRLSHALEGRGLHLSPSGNIITQSGHKMSMEEAKEAGLLEGVDEEMTRQREHELLKEFLDELGLKLTPSGRIITDTGELLTFDEARQRGLLRGIDEELLKLRGLTITASGRILTRDGKVFTKAEAERLGLLDDINLDDLYTAESESTSVSSTTATSLSDMSSSDVHYLKNVLGRPLALGLAEVTAKQPRDPIHYLGHWLYKYRYNQEIDDVKKREIAELLEERERLAKIALREQAESGAKDVLIDLLGRVDEEVERIAIEKELKRIESEAAAVEAEEAALESEARDTLGVYSGPTKGQQLV